MGCAFNITYQFSPTRKTRKYSESASQTNLLMLWQKTEDTARTVLERIQVADLLARNYLAFESFASKGSVLSVISKLWRRLVYMFNPIEMFGSLIVAENVLISIIIGHVLNYLYFV